MPDNDYESPEEKEIGQILTEGTARLDALEQQINNLHSDSGLVPRPEGFGYSGYRDLGEKNLKRSFLRTKQTETRLAMFDQADKVISGASPEQQVRLKEQVKTSLQQRDKILEQKEMDDVKKMPKRNISDSQDYANRLLLNKKLENKLNEPEKTSSINAKTEADGAAADTKSNYGSRLKLDYTQNKKDITEPKGEGPSNDIERDR